MQGLRIIVSHVKSPTIVCKLTQFCVYDVSSGSIVDVFIIF